MQIRIASKKDSRRISYLIQRNTERVGENLYSQQQIEIWKKVNTPKAIRDSFEERIIFCAFQNDQLVGTIALLANEVAGLYVSHAKRKLGIGKKLLRHLEDYARKKDIKKLTLTSTISARRFYERNGYKTVKPIVVKINGVAFHETLMTKTLVQTI